ncbi:MAG: helix-turn-helix transcriptional regulator [Gemmatimonadaceae bacterium]
MTRLNAALSALPLVGRAGELAMLTSAMDVAEGGRGGTVILAGEGGVGKTRLVRAAFDAATRRGWTGAMGRAYPVETGVPYAVFSDALVPVLRKLDGAQLQVLSRGGGAELAQLFPAMAPDGAPPDRMRGDPSETKSRLLWTFAQFLGRWAAKRPLLLALENLQWADASSLELLHFLARQIGGERILLLCTYNEAEREQNPTLRTTEQSLLSLGVARVQRVEPLSRDATDELVRQAFNVDRSVTREFSALLWGWTRGNPFFVEETLKALVEGGKLQERDGRWLGWELEDIQLPRTVRDAVVARMDRLGADARAVANLAAVVGTRASYDALRSVSGMEEADLLRALDELRAQRVLVESADAAAGALPAGRVAYDFNHPILQQTLYGELGRARARLLHATVAEALERHYGPRALEHADELAFHFARADATALAGKAVKYLAAAGRDALAKHANREAASYLGAALEIVERSPEGAAYPEPSRLVEDLARARQRVGEYEQANALLERVRAEAAEQGDLGRLAAVERRMGLASYWTGRFDEALAHYEAGIAAAREAGDDEMLARLLLARGTCLQEVGRVADAKREVGDALDIATRLRDPSLLARAHRGLMLLYCWTGPPGPAREHGALAIQLAEESGQRAVGWQAHWAMAMLGGLTGESAEIAHHLTESDRLADELRAPLRKLWTAEVRIEYLSSIGEWEAAVALGERTIAMARALGQRTLLPRVLVWTGNVHLGRGDTERAKRYFDEAWTLSGAGREAGTSARPLDVHSVVPAHAGMAAYHLAMKDYRRAIRIGEQGLALADRSGYVAWAIHRLLPVLGEAALWLADFDRARRYGARLRVDSAKLEHKLGLAWADACDALVQMLGGDKQHAIDMLRRAADELDAIPFVADGARVRRQLALALAETGDREGATRELRRVHDVFARLGAERELSATRDQLRELGARPPARTVASGAAGLTGRELEIVRLVAARRSNKEIGTALGISPRTVSTHLSNIFAKLEVGSRGELTDFVRENGLPEVSEVG